MSIRITCPRCGGEIPVSDVQPAADLAICRACNLTHRLSAIVAGAELNDVDLDTQPRPVTVTNESDTLRIRYKKVSGAAWFLIPFTCLWSGFSMGAIYIKPIFIDGKSLSTGELLGGLPFLIGTLVLLGILAYLLFGHRVIRICPSGRGHGEIAVFNGIGSLGHTRRLRYDPETTVTLEQGGVSVNHQPKDDICLRSNEDELRFGALFAEPSKKYIAALIRETIRS